MANRSYLYATDVPPSPAVKPADGRMIGISEWNYDIPPAFKLLLTGSPRKSISSIWQVPDEIAIVGDYGSGVSRLLRELDKIADPRIADLRSEAKAFLSDSKNQRSVFVLECGEIYELESKPLAEQNDRLWKEIGALSMSDSIEWPVEATKPQSGLLARVFGTRKAGRSAEIDIDSLGLGNWSNVLYYEPYVED